MTPAPHRYASRYCEENVWHLAGEPSLSPGPRFVVFVSNASRACPLWRQRAAGGRARPVVWDYHVFLAVRGERPLIYDLDSALALPCPADEYLDATFGPVRAFDARFHPCFRVVPASEFRERLVSDRSHMRTRSGWSAPPPEWPPIGVAPSESGTNLARFIDMDARFAGEVYDLPGLARFLGRDAALEP